MSEIDNESDTTETSRKTESADESDSCDDVKDYKYYVDNNLLLNPEGSLAWEIQEKELRQLPPRFVQSLQLNAYLYYFPLFMLMGPLIWYLATFPQRAALQSLDPTLNDVFVPFNLSIHTTTNFIEDAKWLVKDVQADGYRLLLRTKYNVIKDPKQKVIVDKGHLNIVILNKDDYEALHPNNDNGIFLSPNLLYLKVEKIGGFEKLKPVMEEVLGLRLTKLKYEENKEDLSKKRLSVWERMPIDTLYHVQFVFLHENGARSVQMEEKIIKETQKFLAMASKYGLLTDISVRHLFDFDVRSFVDSDRKTNETAFRDYQLEPLTTKVDKYTTWTKASGVDKPIVKLALFSSKDRIQLYEGNEQVNGMIVASWGGVSSFSTKEEYNQEDLVKAFSAISDIIQAQVGVKTLPPSLNIVYDSNKVFSEFEWNRFQHQAFQEHVDRTILALKSIHDLKNKLEFMVVTREVAVHVYEAHEILVQTILEARVYGKLDINKVIRARILAERASTHKSLIQFLNFPFDQRYAIYVPFFLPVYSHFFPLCKRIFDFIKQWMLIKLEKRFESDHLKILPFF